MSANTIAQVVSALGSTTIAVDFSGRDGKLEVNAKFTVADLVPHLTPEVLKAIVELAGNSLIHRKGECKLSESPTAAEFCEVALEVATGSAGRFKVSAEDKASAADLLDRLTKLGGLDQWKEKHGFEATADSLAEMFRDQRAARAAAEAKAKAEELDRMLGGIKPVDPNAPKA